jgi:hypothetical protein
MIKYLDVTLISACKISIHAGEEQVHPHEYARLLFELLKDIFELSETLRSDINLALDRGNTSPNGLFLGLTRTNNAKPES